MDAATLQQMLDETFDMAVVHHGYTTYMRDYEVFVYVSDPAPATPGSGYEPVYLRHLFRHCVEARCETALAGETWRESLDDRLIDLETGADLDGYVWGVKWQCLYPGAQVLPESEATRRWSREVGIDFHEVLIETNAQRLHLTFSDLQVSEVPVGYAPFVTD